MKWFNSLRTFLFRCRYGFAGAPVQIFGERVQLDESLRRWKTVGEEFVHEALRTYLGPGDVVLDIGANFGIHTIFAGRLIGAAGLVYAFEPVPANLKLLRRNVNLAHIADRVRVIPQALSNSSRQFVDIHLPEDSIALTASLQPGTTTTRRIQARNSRLDDFSFSGNRWPRLIKLDVEGAELEVLRGAQSLLRHARPILVIEVHGFALPAFGASVQELRNFLGDLGYEETGLHPLDPDREHFQALYQPGIKLSESSRG